ncbi:MAG: hypothetical protein JWP74_1524 [Marmoricola sp.]|nr:hypothetical protein [Marmoricola sp.]
MATQPSEPITHTTRQRPAVAPPVGRPARFEANAGPRNHLDADTVPRLVSRRSVEFEADYARARQTLSRFMTAQANHAADSLGFGWTGVPDAPSTYETLTEAHRVSARTGIALPVSSLHCDTAIFTHPEINHAFRFWHDTLHIATGLTFQHPHELELSLHHLKIAADTGLDQSSMAYQLLRIDLIGQNYLVAVADRFALDQELFVRTCLTEGLEAGLIIETTRSPANL